VRGLKRLWFLFAFGHILVAPSRVRGLKQQVIKFIKRKFRRTLTGAWIETKKYPSSGSILSVAPSRVRGLKPSICTFARILSRRTLTGAWIETGKW